MTSTDEERTEELPQPNLPLLRKVLDHIDAHPEEWAQGTWAQRSYPLERHVRELNRGRAVELPVPACGTAFCIAGHAAVMAGFTVSWPSDATSSALLTSGDHIEDVARDELGLTAGEARVLFWGRNTRAEVQRIAVGIAERAGERL